MNLSELTAAQLRRAATLKEQLEELQKKLAGILGSEAKPITTVVAPRKKRKMSAQGRANIAAAAKARWAKVKGKGASAAKPKKKFTMSAVAKAAISRAAKARWAKIKAAQKK